MENSRIWQAVESCACTDVCNLLEYCGADTNLLNSEGMPVLHLAAMLGNLQNLQQLLSHGSLVTAQDQQGQTALHVAVSEGYLDIVDALLAHHADPNAQDFMGQAPLHIAAQKDHLLLITLLLEKGAERKLMNNWELTAQELATREDVKQLLAPQQPLQDIQEELKQAKAAMASMVLELADMQAERTRIHQELVTERAEKESASAIAQATEVRVSEREAQAAALTQALEAKEQKLVEAQQQVQAAEGRLLQLQTLAASLTRAQETQKQQLVQIEERGKAAQARVYQLEQEAASFATVLRSEQQEHSQAERAAQEAEGRVAQLEANAAASAQTLADEAQLREAKLLPWSPAMAPLFLDPSKLNQGSLLGLSSRGAHTYSGSYRRTDSSLPVQVALKMLDLPGRAGRGGFEERVRKVWQASTDSHHICHIYGVSCLDGHACLVMKLYPYSLASKTAMSGHGPQMPLKAVIQVAIDICRGLQDVHAAGMIVRNLSQALYQAEYCNCNRVCLFQSNVLICDSGSAVLADFGLALYGDTGSNDQESHYSSPYRLPETSAGITDKADIYMLGCLLVEMCTRELRGAGLLTLKVFHPEGDNDGSPLVDIMRRCLCAAPEGRPTAAVVQQGLEALQPESQSIQSGLSSPDSPQSQPLKIVPV
ncbi:hypothetical protein ABBQ38_008227 [Trebouxia sp. C0009 RCD-2024]